MVFILYSKGVRYESRLGYPLFFTDSVFKRVHNVFTNNEY